MKELGSILFLLSVFSTGAFYNISSQFHMTPSDSSKVSFAPVVQSFGLSGGVVQNLDINNQIGKLSFDCNAFPPDSTFPKMKTFIPDTSLTASMPVYKPGPVDPGIFIPGGECFDPGPRN